MMHEEDRVTVTWLFAAYSMLALVMYYIAEAMR